MSEQPSASLHRGAATPSAAWVVAFVTVLIANGSLSNFYRTSNAVIAPELIRDLSLSPQMLGVANGAFFWALLVAQVPLGVLFDRVGVHRTVSALFVIMIAGASLHALADTGEMLFAARFLVGLGCAGSFMTVIVLVPRWFARDRWSSMLGLVFGCSQLGIFAAGPPLAYAAETVGWRAAFLWCAALSAVIGVAFWAIVRDRPVDTVAARVAAPATSPGIVAGLGEILAIPGMLKLFALFGVAYPTFVTIMALWAGPYLKDVHDLGPIARGHVFAVLAAAVVVGNFVIGPIDRRLRRSKTLVLGSALVTLATFLLLALVPRPPLWLALTLLVLMATSASYAPVLVTQMRSRFPEHLAGRGATTANIAQLFGSALLPTASGWIPPLFMAGTAATAGAGGYSPEAYRAIFAMLAVVLAAGLAVYATFDDRTSPKP